MKKEYISPEAHVIPYVFEHDIATVASSVIQLNTMGDDKNDNVVDLRDFDYQWD